MTAIHTELAKEMVMKVSKSTTYVNLVPKRENISKLSEISSRQDVPGVGC